MTELIVALDFPDQKKARSMVEKLEGLPLLYKVGLELFTAEGPDLVRELVASKKRVFLDLKLHDIPNTVSKAALSVADLGVEMFTLHLGGGSEMIRQTRTALDEKKADSKIKILGVSVLTSFDSSGWNEVGEAVGSKGREIPESVLELAKLGVSSGIHGLVCSPKEVESISKKYPDLYTVVPGIRPKGFEAGDQKRIMTPKEAKKAGAKAIVVGRPITQSSSPRESAQKILEELA